MRVCVCMYVCVFSVCQEARTWPLVLARRLSCARRCIFSFFPRARYTYTDSGSSRRVLSLSLFYICEFRCLARVSSSAFPILRDGTIADLSISPSVIHYYAPVAGSRRPGSQSLRGVGGSQARGRDRGSVAPCLATPAWRCPEILLTIGIAMHRT